MTQVKYYDSGSSSWKAVIAGPIGPTGPTGAAGPGLQAQTTLVSALTFTTTSVFSTFVDITGLSVDITPSSSSSKILVLVSISGASSGNVAYYKILRGATNITPGTDSGWVEYNTNSTSDGVATTNYVVLDSPATTSATTYKVQVAINSGTFRLNRRVTDATYRGTSSITAVEIKA
jgi:hypothetical protein